LAELSKNFISEQATTMNGAPSSTCPRLLDGQVCGGFIVSDPFAGRVCEQCGNVVEDVDVLRSEIESQHFDSGASVGNYVAADDTGIHISHGAGYKDAVATRQHLARVSKLLLQIHSIYFLPIRLPAKSAHYIRNNLLTIAAGEFIHRADEKSNVSGCWRNLAAWEGV